MSLRHIKVTYQLRRPSLTFWVAALASHCSLGPLRQLLQRDPKAILINVSLLVPSLEPLGSWQHPGSLKSWTSVSPPREQLGGSPKCPTAVVLSS